MRLWIYLGMLAAMAGVLGVSAAVGVRPQVRSAPKTWRAIGALQPRLSHDGESIASKRSSRSAIAFPATSSRSTSAIS